MIMTKVLSTKFFKVKISITMMICKKLWQKCA